MFTACKTFYFPPKNYTATSSKVNNGERMQNGQCYAKCTIPDEFEEVEINYIKYTGNNPNQAFIKKRIIQKGGTFSKWEKKRSDKKCLSPNPNDCLVWCLIEKEQEEIVIYEVTDTTQCKDFVIETRPSLKITKEGGYTEWKEVVCQHKITPTVLKLVSERLLTKGFETASSTTYNAQYKSVLTHYQQHEGLPIGQFDFETLESLGIDAKEL